MASCLRIDLIKFNIPNNCDSSTKISILTENDIMNNNDKNNPIVPYYYYFEKVFVNNDIIYINYNYQYIKFDSDEGIFFQNFKTYNAIGFSDMEYDVQNYDFDYLLIYFFLLYRCNSIFSLFYNHYQFHFYLYYYNYYLLYL